MGQIKRQLVIWGAIAATTAVLPGLALADNASPDFGGHHGGRGHEHGQSKLAVAGRAVSRAEKAKDAYGIEIRGRSGDKPTDAGGMVRFAHRTDKGAGEGLVGNITCLSKDSAGIVTATGTIKRGADRLARQLSQSGLTVAAIHGDRSQGQREKALAAFSGGRVQALIATDVAARGIHVDDVACVLHFDPPQDEKAYVHRSGRTGRAGAGGTVLSLVTDDTAGAVKILQKALGLPRLATAPDLTGLGPVIRVNPAPRETPAPAATDARKPDGTKRERARRDWGAAAGVPTPRRKPDGRPARSGGRRRAQTRRSA